MTGKGAAGMNAIPVRNLAPQESMPFIADVEGFCVVSQ
jgi:hypothetical protein